MSSAPCWRVVAAFLLIGLVPAACSSPPAAEDASKARALGEASDGAGGLDRMRLESGIAVFADGDDRLAAIDDGELLVIALTGNERWRQPLAKPVTALTTDGAGGFWLLGHDWAGRWRDGDVALHRRRDR